MSLWKEIKDQDDVELSEDGTTIDVLYSSDHNGNNYIEIPIGFVKNALPEIEVQCANKNCKSSDVIEFVGKGLRTCQICGHHWKFKK